LWLSILSVTARFIAATSDGWQISESHCDIRRHGEKN
jgi:hypothetical protein